MQSEGCVRWSGGRGAPGGRGMSVDAPVGEEGDQWRTQTV